jgi:hypothetical protein
MARKMPTHERLLNGSLNTSVDNTAVKIGAESTSTTLAATVVKNKDVNHVEK